MRFYQVCALLLVLLALNVQAAINADIRALQMNWARLNYQTPDRQQQRGLEVLLRQAQNIRERYPNSAEAFLWSGIIETTWAGVLNESGSRRSALSATRRAKTLLEKSIKIKALSAAYTYLGVLYYQVPEFPIGFGDNHQAQQLLEKALAMTPDDMDANFFYGDFLLENGKLDSAERFLRKVLNTPVRAEHKVADAGRQRDAQEALAKLATENAKRRKIK